jgi:predicted RNA binding protein YcfA (HicA-like mRNA interferase family)
MKLPRDVSGGDLTKALKRLGYVETRQSGSHIRLTSTKDGEHHLTIPAHDPLKLGTLAAIIADIAQKMKISKEEAVRLLFG